MRRSCGQRIRPILAVKTTKFNNHYFYNFCPNIKLWQYAHLHMVILHPSKLHSKAASCWRKGLDTQTDIQGETSIPSNFSFAAGLTILPVIGLLKYTLSQQRWEIIYFNTNFLMNSLFTEKLLQVSREILPVSNYSGFFFLFQWAQQKLDIHEKNVIFNISFLPIQSFTQ